MVFAARLLLALGALVPLQAATVFGPGIDATQFRVTTFLSGLAFPQAMLELGDGSILIQTSPGFGSGNLLRYADLGLNGIADLPGTSVYSNSAGPLTQLVAAGSYFLQGNYGDHSISILEAGATADAPLTEVGRLEFDFGPDLWWHDTLGLAVRPTPGSPGSFDLVFNVGSQFDAAASVDTVGLDGLISDTLQADSLYMVTLDLTGAVPSASNLVQVASGIRNAFGLAFDETTGDLYFSENAIDGDPFPPQAEELNRIPAADLGVVVPDFGFPDCYPDYFTGVHAMTGCTEPVAAFTPISGMFSQGAAQIAFAPPSFPAPFNEGIFVVFTGTAARDRNPLIFVDPITGDFIHFLLGDTGQLRPTGILATSDSLFISDFLSGDVIQIRAAVPEPGTWSLAAWSALGIGIARLRRRSRRAENPAPGSIGSAALPIRPGRLLPSIARN